MTLKLNGSSSGSVSIDAPASTTSGADITFKLPVADGTNGQALTTNASGQLAFSSMPTTDQVAKAWVGANSDGDSTIDSYNISSVTFTNNAEIVVQFDTDFANANYCVVTGGYRTDTDGATALAAIMVDDIGNHAAGQCSLKAITSNSGGTVAYATGVDYRFWAVFFGDQ